MTDIQDISFAGKQTPLDNRGSAWNRCMGMAIPRLCQAVEAALSHAAGVLSDLSQKPLDPNHRRLTDQARQMALQCRGGIATAFRSHFVQLIEGDPITAPQLASNATPKALLGRQHAAAASPDVIAHTIRKVCHWELRGIDSRFRELEKPDLYSGLTNPFSPDLIGQALGTAMEELGLPITQRNMLAPMIAEPLAIEVRTLYRDLMDLVAGKGLHASPASPARAPCSDGIGGTGASRPGELFMQGSTANQSTPSATANTPAYQAALLALSRLQRTHAETSPGQGSEGIDTLNELAKADFIANTGNTGRIALDMTATMFEAIASDKGLPSAIKAQLSRLQIPMLKAALLDAGMFRNQAHPARHLLYQLAESGKDSDQHHANLALPAIKQAVDRICGHFNEDLQLFTAVSQDFGQTILRLQQSQIRHTDVVATEAAPRLDGIDSASIRKTIGFHIQDSRLPKFALTFLFEHWETVYRAIYSKPDKSEQALAEPSAAMSTLIRTLEPRNWHEDRTAMLSLLPTLLKRLRLGMQAAAVSQAEQDRFLAGLAKCHAVVMQAAKELATNLPKAALATAPTSKALATTEQTSMADSVAKTKADKHDALVRGLQRGTLIEFQEQGGSMTWLKLAWISPNGSIFVFTNKQGERALTINAAALAERFRQGQAQVAMDSTARERGSSHLVGRLQNVA